MTQYLFLIAFLLFSMSCASVKKQPTSAYDISKATEFKPGKLIIIQGPTSNSETSINILSPRLKNYKYKVTDNSGAEIVNTTPYETIKNEVLHWKIDKISIQNLKPNTLYTLNVLDEFRSSTTIVDKRTFTTLDIEKNEMTFAYASCMADDYRFNEVIDPMWNRMQQLNPDFVVLNGDVVYVDSFEFVERKKATELDLWFRFIDSFNRIPIYKWHHLKPIFATWDDHDFGTNDGDRDFKEKQAARKIFLGFFGGRNIENVYKVENESVYFSLNMFKQKMLFLDDRYFRQPNKEQKEAEKFAHWGEQQHNWVIKKINEDNTPTWLFNGNQFFSGVDLSYKESFQSNNPIHFKLFIEEVKKASSPVVLASGDIHFSEIMKIPNQNFGYDTYELTSSSMHSYTSKGWDNPLRIPTAFTKEFNFMLIKSTNHNNSLKLSVQAWGLENKPYFTETLEVKK